MKDDAPMRLPGIGFLVVLLSQCQLLPVGSETVINQNLTRHCSLRLIGMVDALNLQNEQPDTYATKNDWRC